ncbi:hypothetical protein LCGC14_1350100 [marine sediment metagenome]|uniref:N4-gp56 family major capsid protein n=1 Tax=marine sediment metagenome TaxID=412755 RepID=A0A0F9NDF7_9ZZZZ
MCGGSISEGDKEDFPTMRKLKLYLWTIRLDRAIYSLGLAWIGDFMLRWSMPPMRGGVDTNIAAGAAEAAQRWAEDIWLELPERVFWGRYMNTDVNAVIQVKQDLEAQQGEVITFTLARQLTGGGTAGDAALEGNEEAIAFFSDTVTLDQFRNAVRLNGRLAEKRPAFDMRTTAKQLLKDWLAAFIDDRIFTALSTTPTRAVFGGDATSTATIETGDFLNLALISRAKTLARKATPQIFPVNVDGSDYFLLVVSPDSLHDLKVNDANWAQAQREAQVRGESNPLFTGAEGIWDGVLIRSSTRVAVATNFGAGANLNGSDNLFCGRQAGVFAWGRKPEWVEQAFDYANKTGFAIGAIFEVTKAVFNAADNGVIAVRTFRGNIT